MVQVPGTGTVPGRTSFFFVFLNKIILSINVNIRVLFYYFYSSSTSSSVEGQTFSGKTHSNFSYFSLVSEWSEDASTTRFNDSSKITYY